MSNRPLAVELEKLTPQQFDIYQHAVNLEHLLDENVPPSTAHHAVEAARKALRDLIDESIRRPIITRDAKQDGGERGQ